jgi:hypothetical protein
MNVEYLRAGIPVVTAPRIEELAGNGIASDQLRNRQTTTVGVVQGSVLEQRGDVWLVEHGDGKVAAYHHDELLPFARASMPQGFRPR